VRENYGEQQLITPANEVICFVFDFVCFSMNVVTRKVVDGFGWNFWRGWDVWRATRYIL